MLHLFFTSNQNNYINIMFEVGESSSSSNDIESRGVQPITSLKDNKSIGMIEKDNDDLSCEQYST